MKLKFIALYTCFFILIFIIFSFLNFFYKSTISISDRVYSYTISAEQYFDFKNQSLSKVLYRYFSKGKNISQKKLQNLYRIENKKIINSSYTLNKAKSTISNQSRIIPTHRTCLPGKIHLFCITSSGTN